MPTKPKAMSKKQQSNVILYYWEKGMRTAREIQCHTNIGLSTIYYNLEKLKKSGSVARKIGSGRPRKINNVGAKIIGQNIRHNPSETTKSLTNKLSKKGIRVCRHTVGRHLRRLGYKNSLSLVTPLLTAKHKQVRVEWAKKHIGDDWSRTLFFDETAFQLFRNTITKWHKNSRPVRPIPKDRKKIFAWGGFSTFGKTSLYCFTNKMNAEFYVQILKKQLPEIKKMMGIDWRLQQDNDPKHTSRLAKKFIEKNVLVLMDWPSNSPDLNPIENMWSLIKRNVESRKPQNLADLKKFMAEEWMEIPNDVINNLVGSMKTRCKKVIKAKGERINY